MSEQTQSNEDIERIKNAARLLGEYFDSVQVFATRHEPTKDATFSWQFGVGNVFTRKGHVRSLAYPAGRNRPPGRTQQGYHMTPLTHHVLATLSLSLCRAADILSSYLASPDLKLELNPVVRYIGFRNWIFINVILICLCPLLTDTAVIILCSISLIAASINLLQLLK